MGRKAHFLCLVQVSSTKYNPVFFVLFFFSLTDITVVHKLLVLDYCLSDTLIPFFYFVFCICRHTSFWENFNSMMLKYAPKRNSFE